MKKIAYLIIIGFIIASASSIYITIVMGRNFENFNDDDEDIEDGGLNLGNNPKNHKEYNAVELNLSVINYQYSTKNNKASYNIPKDNNIISLE